LFETYLEKRAQKLSISKPRDKAALLENVKAINAQSNKLTIAGALIFSDTPQIDPQLSNAIVRAARFKGKHGGDFIDQAEISGDLMHQIENAVKFVVKNITLSSSSAGLQRQDSYQFPLKVIREVITNAIIHRDYSVKNENIKIAIYDDRLEVTSPGGLPGTVTVENIISMQHSRNPIISKIMFETGYLEAWGLGIDSIIEWCEKSGNIPPVFIDDGIQFKVSIFSVRRKEAKTKSENLTQREKFILELISKHALLNNGTIREKSNLSKTQTHSALTKLLKLKLISRNGKGPATTYKVR
jgi:predicted HTH transcriptional regulator